MEKQKTGLKRGLDALLAGKTNLNTNQNQTTGSDLNESVGTSSQLQTIPVEFLKPGKYQPRKEMDGQSLEELADSIRVQGIIQPVVIRPLGKDSYEIIAGERRWRAAQKAGLSNIPVIIKEVSDEVAIAMSLIENIQREDLNAIDEAVALQRLMQEFELTQQQVAEAIGKSRTTVTNLLRLLSLNEETRTMLERGDIEMGHARAMLALVGEQQNIAARTVAEKGLSVRDAEKLVRKLLSPEPIRVKNEKSRDVTRLETSLSEHIGSSVQIQYNNKGKGKLVIQYSSLDELDGIIGKMGGNAEN